MWNCVPFLHSIDSSTYLTFVTGLLHIHFRKTLSTGFMLRIDRAIFVNAPYTTEKINVKIIAVYLLNQK